MGDRSLHDHNTWVFGDVLSKQAARYGDRTWIQMVDGQSLSFRCADEIATQVARFLIDLKVSKGDTIAVFIPNSLEYCYAWFGIARVGAIHVAVNIDYKGVFLTHVLNNSRAKFIMVQAEYLDRIKEVERELEYLEKVLVVGAVENSHGADTQFTFHLFDDYKRYSNERTTIPVSYRDPACVMYTSGTTGPSKGVVMPHAHIYLFGLGTIENMRLTEEDVFYIVLPLFHANGMFMQLYATLIIGAKAVLRGKFSAGRWIHDIAEYDATVTNSLGVVIAFVLSQVPNDLDKRHKLRAIGVAPNPVELDAQLRERFGVRDVFGMYGMTEVNIPLYTQAGIPRPGSCGRVWERYYELQIVDPESDLPVPPNTVGEIVVRPKLPFGFMSEYMNMPEKTVEAWRNFWFHTGDAATMDEQGFVYFVDRIKDCIRRRGENISSFEIERVVGQHPAVAEVAAVAVKSEIRGGEDEVKVVVVLQKNIDFKTLTEYCQQHLPRFAVPRYVEFVESLPKTPTNKIQKNLLRELAITPGTWDRERDGIG
ncbi:MAG: AMP-binding protein [Arenicellales bacterium]|nr:AMP-binding protein [Arenicellales bacterium]